MYLKASYTVESSLVISICLIVIGMCILLGFELYKDSVSYIDTHPIKDIDAVRVFREIQAGEEIVDGLVNR